MIFLEKPLMQNAQIWKSIEALCDEAEAVVRTGAPMMAVVESTAPPALSQPQKSASAATDKSPKDSTTGSLSILQGRPTPPTAILEKHRPKHHSDSTDAADHMTPTGTVTPASMADIAAAIEQVAKAPPSADRLSRDTSLDDHIRQQMIGEISQAVRAVLATELPKMVRHAVSASLYELITTNNPAPAAGATIGQPPRKASRKKPAAKKIGTKKTTAKKARATKAASKKAAPKKAAPKKRAAK
jgi:hypothetical protein